MPLGMTELVPVYGEQVTVVWLAAGSKRTPASPVTVRAMPGNAIPPVLRGDIYLLLEQIGLERYSDISLTVIVCYANDCERATVQLS